MVIVAICAINADSQSPEELSAMVIQGGYQFGCETQATQASCELLIEGEKFYYPEHPDIAASIF